ncbi:MAG TPA: GNAT family N-acetyltransferase [Spirillospora sp.]
MAWTVTDNCDDFLAAAGGFLRADPASNTVALTVTEEMRAQGPGPYGNVLFGWWTSGDRVEGAFLLTGGYPPQLSAMPGQAARDLAGVLAGRGAAVTGAGGNRDATEAFADAWTRQTGATCRVQMRQGLYRLDGLRAPDPPPEGAARTVRASDGPLVRRWSAEFSRDVGEHGGNRAMLDSRLATGRVMLWEAGGRPVSMAWWSPVVAGMSRVSAVYTPAPHRRRGYGAAVTAAASRAAIDEGATDVVLFTDLANPASNAVYRRIGYRQVEERVMLAFA